jgi:hypothetical protein
MRSICPKKGRAVWDQLRKVELNQMNFQDLQNTFHFVPVKILLMNTLTSMMLEIGNHTHTKRENEKEERQ